MASPVEMEKETAGASEEDLSLELPAPLGWQKKFVPTKSGTPKKHEIIFTTPTGEEITGRRQLDQYLKAHPGGPAASEFDWSSGETPRRSARISEKVKIVPPSRPTKKRSRTSSSSFKKGSKETESASAPEETEVTKEVDMQEAEKDNKELEAEKVATENQDENERPNSDFKTDGAPIEEAKVEMGADVSAETEEGKAGVESETGKVKIDGDKVQEKEEQPQVGATKEHGSEELDKPDTAVHEEKKNVIEEDKEKYISNLPESGEEIKEEAVNSNNEKPPIVGTDEVKDKMVENGCGGIDAAQTQP